MSKILVTGVSGTLGHMVADILLTKYPGREIYGTTRNPEKVADLAARGLHVRKADFNDVESLHAAFKGIDRVFIVSVPDLAPGARSKAESAAIDAAVAVGVKHILYSSFAGASAHSPLSIAVEYYATEQHLKSKTGVTHTILGNGLWTESGTRGLAAAAKSGKHYHACGDGRCNMVTRKDCAEVAAAALASENVTNERLAVVGPAALTQAEIVSIFNEVTGNHVEAVQVPASELVKSYLGMGFPQMVAELLPAFDTATAAGDFNIGPSDVVQKYTGHAATSVRDYLTQNKEAFTAKQ